MKIYVDELPKDCAECEFYECQTDTIGEWGIEKHRHICKINGSLIQSICPLHSLANHDKKVRAGVVAENQALKERWGKLKEYIEKSIEADNKYLKSFPNNMNFENYRTTKRVILETMKELEK